VYVRDAFYTNINSADVLGMSPTKQLMESGVYGEYVMINNYLNPMHKCNVGHATPICLAYLFLRACKPVNTMTC